MSDFATPWTAACQTSLSFTISQSLLRFMSSELVMLSNYLTPLSLLPSILPSELALRVIWSKYWSLSFNISPSNEYSGLISFRLDCLDYLSIKSCLNCQVYISTSNSWRVTQNSTDLHLGVSRVSKASELFGADFIST